MKLIGIISHQGTKDQGHYLAIMNRGNEWTSYNDAITAHTTLTQLHQTQAYIMIYRKMEHSDVTEIDAHRDSTKANQQSPAKKSKSSHKTLHSYEESPLNSGPPIKIPEKNHTREDQTLGPAPTPTPYIKRDLPLRTWRYSQPSLAIALPHRPQTLGGRVRWEGQQS